MKPTQKVTYTSGLHNALGKIQATMRDPYAWVARQGDTYVITVEIDHQDQERNRYNHLAGIFQKIVPPLSKKLGHSPQTIRHAQELLDTIADIHRNNSTCKMLLVKGTKNGTSDGVVKAALDGDLWRIQEVSGTVSEGYEFIVYRAGENTSDS